MSLYKDASLVMIPSAYKDGRLYSIRPVQELGDELVTNGGFDSGTGWSTASGWSISSGTLQGTNVAAVSATQGGYSFLNKSFRVEYTITEISQGDVRIYLGGTQSTPNRNAVGTYVEYIDITTANSTLYIQGINNFTGKIDNISVKEVITNGDFTFSRGSNLAATRVDVNGLIEKGRENLLFPSENTNTGWSASGTGTNTSSIQTGQQDPNGGTRGFRWTATCGSTINDRAFYRKSHTRDGSYLTLSFWVKSANGSNQTLTFHYAGGQRSTINVTTEWQRVEYGEATGVGVGFFGVEIRGTISDESADVYLYGWQLEKSLVATDYIETGASTAQAGILEDMPRLDYSGSCPALLLEPQRTNGVGYSEYFDGTGWSKNGGITTTINTSAVQSPEGLYNATLLTSANATSEQQMLVSSLSTTSGTSYAFSVFAKKKDYDFIHLRFQGSGSAFAAGSVYFNISSGSVGHEDSGKTGYIEDYGNGWYRCTAVATATATSSGAACRVQLASSDNAASVVGDGVKGTYVYGATFEAGSYPTSYIPTYGASVTRSKDTTNVEDFSSFLTGEDVTYMFELKSNESLVRDDSSGNLLFQHDGNLANSFRVYRASSNSIKTTIVWFDGDSVNNPAAYVINSATPKVAIRRIYSTGEWDVFVDGVKTYSATNTNFLNFTRIHLQGAGTPQELKQFVVFDTALTDSECIALTTL